MKLDKTLLRTLCIAGAALTSGCVVDGGYVHHVAPAPAVVVPTTTVVAPAPAVIVPTRSWYHVPRFWGHGHHHHHHHGRHR